MISLSIYLFICALIWALLEIQIEGPHGWAAHLPTWRIEKHVLLDLFYGGRPLTGYHVWAFSFVFVLFHMPFVWGIHWGWREELKVIGCYDLFWVAEDFLWFVLNPHFGWKKFNKKEVWWHKRWFLNLPIDYWVLVSVGFFMIWVGNK